MNEKGNPVKKAKKSKAAKDGRVDVRKKLKGPFKERGRESGVRKALLRRR